MGARNQTFDPNLLWAGLLVFGLFAVILFGVSVLKILRKVYIEPDESSRDVLEVVRAAHLAGEMDDAEFQRVTEYLKQPSAHPTRLIPQTETDSSEVPETRADHMDYLCDESRQGNDFVQ